MKTILWFVAGAVLASLVFLSRGFFKDIPDSAYVSPQAAAASKAVKQQMAPHIATLLTADIEEKRAVLDEVFFAPRIATARSLYAVQEKALTIDGVYTEEFLPADGIAPEHQDTVLINLHGGAFEVGARTEGRLESIPVAAVARMRVISVDYRQGPEHEFPAGSEDVATVYQHLLKNYSADNIGIFGCSAGGLLTAQAVAWIASEGLPRPGAVGIFCAGAGQFGQGDAALFAKWLGSPLGGGEIAYFKNADWNDPLVAPLNHPKVLAGFPSTLLITSTRDGAMSSTLVTHQKLVSAGVPAQLHVYEGLGHYFFADTELPESRHVFSVIAEFFSRELGAVP